MFISSEGKKKSWNDYVFILPCVSVGNVGQLAADVLISTRAMKRVGYVYHDSIVPVVGNNPFADHRTETCELTTSCDVYEDTENKLLVLQQRSPFVKGRRGKFAIWLSDWIRTENFRQVIILTSSYAEERVDTQIQGSQFRFLASSQVEKSCGELFRNTLHWKELEKRLSPPGLETESTEDRLFIPGSGIAKQVYNNLKEDLSVVALLLFCSEGDNAPDAVAMVTQLNNWLQIVKVEGETGLSSWKVPASWRLVFGSRADQTLFN